MTITFAGEPWITTNLLNLTTMASKIHREQNRLTIFPLLTKLIIVMLVVLGGILSFVIYQESKLDLQNTLNMLEQEGSRFIYQIESHAELMPFLAGQDREAAKVLHDKLLVLLRNEDHLSYIQLVNNRGEKLMDAGEVSPISREHTLNCSCHWRDPLVKKILIVDDELSLRRSLYNTFKNSYQVETASSGFEAIKKVEGDDFDLVLLDQKMPDLDGLQVLKEIKRIDDRVSIIMITAYGSIESSVEAMKLGAYDFILKPYELDEIGDLSLKTQPKLLRFLQDGKIERLGSNKAIQLDVRLIAATNQDIASAIEEGTFRKDLYYRINTLTIEIPPLRDRKEDIPLLANHFLSLYAGIHQKQVTSISPQVIEQFMHYSWPGNIRELEKVIERGVVLSKGTMLDTGDLPDEIRDTKPVRAQSDFTDTTLSASVELLEKKMIQNALDTTNGNREKAAKVLGISLRSLQYKIKKYFS